MGSRGFWSSTGIALIVLALLAGQPPSAKATPAGQTNAGALIPISLESGSAEATGVRPRTASSPGHIDSYGVYREPDGGWLTRFVSDRIVFSGDITAGLQIRLSEADLHDTWTFNYYFPGNAPGGTPDLTCPIEILAPGDPGNSTGQTALIAFCGGSPYVFATFAAGCPCTPSKRVGAGAVLKGRAAASKLGDWQLVVDFASGAGVSTPGVITETMTLIYTPRVVVLHGWESDCGAMGTLISLLRQELAVVESQVACYGYDSRKGVKDAAAGLALRLREIRAGLPADQPIHLVGHSMGGLVARWYYEKLHVPADGPIGSISMLGTPNRGVFIAALENVLCSAARGLLGTFACAVQGWVSSLVGNLGLPDLHSAAVKDLKPNSKVLRALNGSFALPDYPVYRAHAGRVDTPQGWATSLSGRNDCFVSEESVAGPGAVFGANSTYPIREHFGLHHSAFGIFGIDLGPLTGCSEPTLTDDVALVDSMLPDIKGESIPLDAPAPNVADPPAPSLQTIGTALEAIDQGGQKTHAFDVPAGLPSAAFTVSWLWASDAADLDVTLLRPDGTPAAPGDPDVTVLDSGSATAFYVFSRGFQITSAAAGTWRVVVDGTTVPQPTAYLASLQTESGVGLTVDVGDDPIPGGQVQLVTAQLDDNGTLVAPTTLDASLIGLDGAAAPLVLHDDGLDGDATAGDLVYSAQVDTTGGCGTYRVQVIATGSTSEGAVTREEFTTYDLSVPGDVVRDPCNPDEDADGLTDADEQDVYQTDALGADTDGDGYSDGQEVALGEDPLAYCNIMRADLNGDGIVNGLDLGQFAMWFPSTVPPAPERVDQNGDGNINGLDLGAVSLAFTKSVSECG